MTGFRRGGKQFEGPLESVEYTLGHFQSEASVDVLCYAQKAFLGLWGESVAH